MHSQVPHFTRVGDNTGNLSTRSIQHPNNLHGAEELSFPPHVSHGPPYTKSPLHDGADAALLCLRLAPPGEPVSPQAAGLRRGVGGPLRPPTAGVARAGGRPPSPRGRLRLPVLARLLLPLPALLLQEPLLALVLLILHLKSQGKVRVGAWRTCKEKCRAQNQGVILDLGSMGQACFCLLLLQRYLAGGPASKVITAQTQGMILDLEIEGQAWFWALQLLQQIRHRQDLVCEGVRSCTRRQSTPCKFHLMVQLITSPLIDSFDSNACQKRR